MKSKRKTSVVDLVVLGFLLKEPRNAYALAQLVEQKSLSRLLKISRPVVYKSCRRLSEAKFLKSKIIRDSEAPEKVVYSVNAQGKKYFYNLMKHYSSRINPFHFESNSFIWNLYHCEYKEGLNMLKNLQVELTSLLTWLKTHEKEEVVNFDFCVRMVVKQYRMVLIAMVNWIDETIEEYIGRGGAQ
ncbi:hypothetical protein MNBD_UNCLBAC01-202 [hydrothermal vent metagenome]|uniref:Uncharacterized protein n=1 Tax=hydrothermal vent metagenome TaxID=652676 RepID=A0A3B1D4T8_9ZZZZ